MWCVVPCTPTSGRAGLVGDRGCKGTSYTEHSGHMGDGHGLYLDWAGGSRSNFICQLSLNCILNVHSFSPFNSVQSLSRVQLFVTPCTPGLPNFHSILKLMSIESVMPSNHLILSHPLLLLPFPALGSFPVSLLFPSGGQSIGASASFLPMNIQD